MIKSTFKKIIGTLLIIIGLAALFTPFTPGSWLIFVGLEFIGLRILFWDKIKAWLSAKGGSASRSGSETLQGRTTGGKK